jgi:hypothetical protein
MKGSDTTDFSRWYFNFEAKHGRDTFETPPGFSRWYFNFIANQLTVYASTPPGFSRWYFNFRAASENSYLAQKLKYHRLKPGGVSNVFAGV